MSLQDSVKFQISTCQKLLIFFSGRVFAQCEMADGLTPLFDPLNFLLKQPKHAKTYHAYPWPSNLEPFLEWKSNEIYIYVYIYIYPHTHIYIYKLIERERERERENEKRESWEDHLSSTRAPCISQEFRRFLSSHVAAHLGIDLCIYIYIDICIHLI